MSALDLLLTLIVPATIVLALAIDVTVLCAIVLRFLP